MNMLINLFEEYVNCVDTTTKQTINWIKITIVLFSAIVSFCLFYLEFKYLREKYFLF